MRSPGNCVRQTALLLALLSPVAVTDAQVAIQVKNPSLSASWSSQVQLSSLVPLTFRWRWDGAETPKAVAWQVATVTPASMAGTLATRSGDLIASETGMRLAAQTVKGGTYEEFTVNPEKSWPAKFYIRVRVNTERTSVFSRWVTVSVVQREAVVVNPSCTIQAFKRNDQLAPIVASKTVQITAGEIVDHREWPEQRVLIRITNRLSTSSVNYRIALTVTGSGKPVDTGTLQKDFSQEWWNPDNAHTLAASATETLTIVLKPFPSLSAGMTIEPPEGVLSFVASISPASGAGTSCSFMFTRK